MKKLTKDDERILFHTYKKYFENDYKPFLIQDLVYDLIKEYNQLDIIKTIAPLNSNEFIVLAQFGELSSKLGGLKYEKILSSEDIQKSQESPNIIINDITKIYAPDVDKITEIKKILKYRRGMYWLKVNCILTWQFIWKHFIVTIIVAALTAYIITTYITPP